MSYRKYYWREATRQILVALEIIWYGVIRNKGHHSQWKVKPAKRKRV